MASFPKKKTIQREKCKGVTTLVTDATEEDDRRTDDGPEGNTGLEAVKSVITKRPKRVTQPSLKYAGPDWVAHG